MSSRLHEDDLSEVLGEVYDVRARWYNLGLSLKVAVSTLDVIATQYRDPGDALREMMHEWLKGVNPLPTWEGLIEALRSRILNQVLLADQLELKYCPPVAGVPEHIAHAQPQAGPTRVDATLVPWKIAYSELEFGDEVGRGSYGLVYKGQWKSKSGPVTVAIKALKDPSEHKEAEILMRLRHRNILKFYGAASRGTADYYIVIEYAENGSLFDYIEGNPDPDFQKSLDWAKGIARGLRYLHGEKIIHGDLKSHNVLFSADWIPKICDFGSAKIYDGTMTRTMQSTYAWAAPEVINAEKVSLSCDIFSFGIILWELLTHKRPFDGEQGFKVARKITDGERPVIPPSCPQYLVTLVTNCWNCDPKVRPSAEHAVIALDTRDPGTIVSPKTETQPHEIRHSLDETPPGAMIQPRNGGLSHNIKGVELRDLVRHVKTTRWYELGLELGVDDFTLDTIDVDARGDNNKGLRHMFREWLKACEEPTWEAVVQALKAIGEQSLASQLESQLH